MSATMRDAKTKRRTSSHAGLMSSVMSFTITKELPQMAEAASSSRR